MSVRPEKRVALFLALVSLIVFTGCTGKKAPEPASEVPVGALFPLSGDLNEKGKDSANGVRMAVEEINAQGGIAALGGAKLKLVLGDTQGNPETGIKETERLIEKEKVVAIIGTYQSSVTKMATQVAERLETPFIVSISIADVITERGFRYTFRIQPKAQFYARDQVQFLRDLESLAGYPVRSVALLHENTDFGTATSLAQKSALREKGLDLAVEVSYKAEGVTHLDREVAQVLAAKPDAILAVTYLKDSILIRRALAKAGAKVPLIDTAGGTVSAEYVQILGPLAEGTLTVAEYSKYAAGGQGLNDRFRKRFGVDITGDSAHAYQAVLVLKDSLERAATRDKKKLRKALTETDLRQGSQMILPSERLRFDANGQNEFARLYVVQIQKKELVPVWPAPYATARVVLGK